MQCREVRDLLDSFLSQELLVETNHELMRHLETCANCRAELDARRQLRGALRRAFSNAGALQPPANYGPDTLARVRLTTPRRSGWPRRAWAALAASVALIAGTASFLLLNARVSSVVRDAVGDHRNCAVQFRLSERPIPLADAAARYDRSYARLLETPPDDFVTAAGPVHVRERHSCVFAGRRFGHVVMQLDGHLVSLLVTGDEPAAGTESSVALSSLPRVDGQHVTSFDLPGHTAFVVSDLDEPQFSQSAQALASIVASRRALVIRNVPRVMLR